MSIFSLRNGKIQIETENLIIPEFKIIYDRDKDKDKEIALKELAFVYFMADYKSIYNNLDEEAKIIQIKKDYFNADWKPDVVLIVAIEKYKLLQETPTMKLLQDARKALDKIRAYYRTVDLEEKDNRGNNVHKITELSNSVANIGKIAESLDKLEEKIKKEQLKDTKIRGQADINDYERE